MAGSGSFVGTRSSGFGGWWWAGRARSTARRGGAGGGHGGRGGVAVPAGTGPDGGVGGGRCELQRGRAVPARAKARHVPRGHCSRRAAATGGHGERRRGETARRARRASVRERSQAGGAGRLGRRVRESEAEQSSTARCGSERRSGARKKLRATGIVACANGAVANLAMVSTHGEERATRGLIICLPNLNIQILFSTPN